MVQYLFDIRVLSFNIIAAKIASFSGDNTNSNFGGSSKRNTNNIFSELETYLSRYLIGVGFNVHTVHTTIKTAIDCLPMNIECIIVKICSFFYIYIGRIVTLKEFR